jgi:hypothetical protein
MLPLVTFKSFVLNELMLTRVSTNVASLTIKELTDIELTEPFNILISFPMKELTVT